jgi:hypothetical protein
LSDHSYRQSMADRRARSQDMDRVVAEDTDVSIGGAIAAEEVSAQPSRADSSVNRKTFYTLKEENSKLRTYLGLVKMCNNSAINKIKTSIQETIESIHVAAEESSPIDSALIVKQLEVIQSEIQNMQSMHTQLEEGISGEQFHIIDTNDIIGDHHRHHHKEPVIVMTTRHEVPRKATGVRKSKPRSSPAKAKQNKEALISAKLLNRVVDNRSRGVTVFVDHSQAIDIVGSSEEREAVANIDNNSSADERENVAQAVVHQMAEQMIIKAPKRPYISEEFKTSHSQRLVEAKRRREEMNRQLEREGKRKPKSRRPEDTMRSVADFARKSPKKSRQIKKKTIGKVIKKKIQSQTIAGAQSIVVPLNQSTLDSLAGQTIQIIASGGTQILCRNDGTFIPATNATQWQTSNTQWTTATGADAATNFSSNQWSQYQT